MDFRASLDPASISEIARFFGFEVILREEVQLANAQVAQMLAERAQAKTWEVFTNPSGQLASTITADVTSPYEAQVVVASPYGHRREVGFSGQTDSLGRYYPNDPGKPYLSTALEENTQEALTIYEAGVNAALGRV